MSVLLAFIASNWVNWLFTGTLALLGWFLKGLKEQLKQEQRKNAAISEGVQSLLRDAIVTAYNKYTDKGCCPIYAKDSLKKTYQAYHNLGGNDVATELYNKLLKMPEERQKGTDHADE